MKGLLLRALESGQNLEMIYLSKNQQISHRKVKILEVYDDSIKAFCFFKKMPRTFKQKNILSIGPERRKRRGA